MQLKSTSFLGGLLLFACGSLMAHHGTNASYQLDKTITVNGTVTEFDFAYPHVQLYFDALRFDPGAPQ